MGAVEPIIRTLNSRFRFNCYKGIRCFTRCCSQRDILLTPYDILRMRKRLGVSSEEFLKKYTSIHINEKSSHPYAMLKMMGNGERKCHFVSHEGCTIYTDRPANCRYYPIGQGIMMRGSEIDEFYFFIGDPYCLGYQEDKEWTIKTWRTDQGVDLYDEMNREWKEIELNRNAPWQPKLDPKKQSLLYMVNYDIDRFRRFIFESRFLDLFDIDGDEIERLKTDDIFLMKFGFKYTKYILMIEETLKVKV